MVNVYVIIITFDNPKEKEYLNETIISNTICFTIL